MWQAVVFIDDVVTPLESWERVAWKIAPGDKVNATFWRMYLVIRNIHDSPEIYSAKSKSIKDEHIGTILDRHEIYCGMFKSRYIWELFGQSLRRIASLSSRRADTVYLYDLEARPELVRYQDQSVSYDVWMDERHTFRRLSTAAFPQILWPAKVWTSGVALFWDSTRADPFQQRLDEALNQRNLDVAYRYMVESRWDLTLLSDLMNSVILYMVAYSLTAPESSDPWYFFNQEIQIEDVIATAVNELYSVGCEVFLSRTIEEFHAWQEHNIMPHDAIQLAG